MSTQTPSTRSDAGPVRRAATLVRDPVRRLAFWGAILIPFSYLPLLSLGVEGTRGALLLAGLFVANVAALVVGHGHNRDD